MEGDQEGAYHMATQYERLLHIEACMLDLRNWLAAAYKKDDLHRWYLADESWANGYAALQELLDGYEEAIPADTALVPLRKETDSLVSDTGDGDHDLLP